MRRTLIANVMYLQVHGITCILKVMVFWKLWKQILTWAQTESFDISKNIENNHDIEFYLVCSQPLLFFFFFLCVREASLTSPCCVHHFQSCALFILNLPSTEQRENKSLWTGWIKLTAYLELTQSRSRENSGTWPRVLNLFLIISLLILDSICSVR